MADGERLLARALQAGLVAIVAVGAWRGEVGVIVNGAVALAVTALPVLVRRDLGVSPDPAVTLWLTAAVFVHAVGMLGVYRVVPLYDQFAHALSGSVVAAAGYATVRTLERHDDDVSFPGAFLAVIVVVVTLAFGVAWELLEYAISRAGALLGAKVLVVYGVDDVALDLAFDAVGGVVVGALGAGPFLTVAREVWRRAGGARDR